MPIPNPPRHVVAPTGGRRMSTRTIVYPTQDDRVAEGTGSFGGRAEADAGRSDKTFSDDPDPRRAGSTDRPAPAVAANPSTLLTTLQAARALSVSVRTIKHLMSDGRLAYVKVGRATRIAPVDLEEYVNRHRRKRRNPVRKLS